MYFLVNFGTILVHLVDHNGNTAFDYPSLSDFSYAIFFSFGFHDEKGEKFKKKNW